jgi:ribosome recycling factor
MLEKIKSDADIKMQKSIEMLKHEFTKLRTGRAHTSILDHLQVEYYGAPTPLNQLAGVTVSDPRTLTVTPYDKNMVAPIDKAIRASELGLNPVTTGTVIRVPMPALTEERRLALIKQMRSNAEDARVSVRNIRRDANNHNKALLKDKAITEDESRRAEDAMQKLTDKYIAEIDKLADEKEADLIQV